MFKSIKLKPLLLFFSLLLVVSSCKKNVDRSISQSPYEIVDRIELEMNSQTEQNDLQELSNINVDDKELEEAKELVKAREREIEIIEYQMTNENIQQALKNAGFYKGKIDGKIGPVSKEAIKNFQKAKGLKIDGVAGKQTWARLKEYLK